MSTKIAFIISHTNLLTNKPTNCHKSAYAKENSLSDAEKLFKLNSLCERSRNVHGNYKKFCICRGTARKEHRT